MSKITPASQLKMKQEGQKFPAITAYDATFAKLFDDEGAHVLLIGDSLGMVLQGGQDTLAVNMDEMVYHTRCVARGASKALVVADMPFMSYATPEQTYQNAARLMAGGAPMVEKGGGERGWGSQPPPTPRLAQPAGGERAGEQVQPAARSHVARAGACRA